MDDEFEHPTQLHWDDVVDVICAGVGPGVLAQAVLWSDLGLSVELADALAPCGVADPDTAAYLVAMTEDLGPLECRPVDLELPLLRAQPVAPRADRRARIEPFVGSRVRDWSARCAVSPFGVVYSAVPEAGVEALRSDSGETVRAAVLSDYRPDAERAGAALSGWLAEQARERDLGGHGMALQRLVFEDGRVAGAAIDTGSGNRLVRALHGVALSTGAVPAEWPAQPELRDTIARVAVVGRAGSRFGRVELIADA
ncbi:MAG: hypothetical protein U0Q47_06070 [Mycobacterium sp.]